MINITRVRYVSTQFCFTDYRIKDLPYKEVNGKVSYVVFQKENYYRKVPKGNFFLLIL